MHRRKFLAANATTISAIAFGPTFTFQDDHPVKGFVTKAGKSRFNEITKLSGKNPNDIKVSGKDTKGNLTVFEYTGNEKGGPPLHIHLKQDEIFFILEGKYLFQVGEEKHILEPGDTIFLPRKVPHAFAQLTDTGKMYFMFQPSGKMEDFFRALGQLTAQPTPEQGAKIFANHEMQVVGAPLQF
jgi:quercetin 2,3-dioxygenase